MSNKRFQGGGFFGDTV